jgi:hypothetical protein
MIDAKKLSNSTLILGYELAKMARHECTNAPSDIGIKLLEVVLNNPPKIYVVNALAETDIEKWVNDKGLGQILVVSNKKPIPISGLIKEFWDQLSQ